jgi:hypothetical protein
MTSGLYAPKLTPEITANAARQRRLLTECMRELNRTPGTVTDEQQANALHRIFARRGIALAGPQAGEADRG